MMESAELWNADDRPGAVHRAAERHILR